MARILIFGDSITWGAYDNRGGWADRLKSFCMERELENPEFEYSVYNLGISGDNSREMIKRFEFEAGQRVEEDKEIIFIFAVGINDSQFIKSENDFRVPENEFRKNIEQLIKLSGKFSSKIVFVGLTAVDESKVNPSSWDNNKSYKNNYIKKYDDIIKSICQNNSIHFIDMFDEFNKLDYKKLLEDGLHPNSEGHKKMFGIVRDFLMKKGVIK